MFFVRIFLTLAGQEFAKEAGPDVPEDGGVSVLSYGEGRKEGLHVHESGGPYPLAHASLTRGAIVETLLHLYNIGGSASTSTVAFASGWTTTRSRASNLVGDSGPRG